MLTAVRAIASMVPATALPASFGEVVDVSAAPKLASQFGAHADSLVSAAGALGAEKQELRTIMATVEPLISAAVVDLTGIARNVLTQTTSVLPQLLSINPAQQAAAAHQLQTLPAASLAAATGRVQQLEADLAAPTAKLNEIAERGPLELTPITAAAGHSGTREASIRSDGSAGARAVAAAESQLGTPYVWGGTTPGGFDCSGLVQWSYAQAGVQLPRMAHEMAIGQPVSPDQLQPGDLAVWDGHVAMYTGDGMMIEAGDPVQKNPVRTSNMGMGFLGFYRPTG